MRLQSLIVTFIQVAVVESIGEVFGYYGANVTLPSEANSSWTLTKIEWSIYTNNTWIATYQKEKTNVNRLDRYKGRLSLNISTGDLTIHNLSLADEMEYSVDLIDDKRRTKSTKIRLSLIKQLQPPKIEVVISNTTNGNCWVELKCTSDDEGVVLTWQNPSVTSSINTSNGSSAVLWALANPGQKQVKFTCNSRKDDKQGSSADHSLTCEDPLPPPQPPTHTWLFFFGVLVGVLPLVIIHRKKIKVKCEETIEKVFPKKT